MGFVLVKNVAAPGADRRVQQPRKVLRRHLTCGLTPRCAHRSRRLTAYAGDIQCLGVCLLRRGCSCEYLLCLSRWNHIIGCGVAMPVAAWAL